MSTDLTHSETVRVRIPTHLRNIVIAFAVARVEELGLEVRDGGCRSDVLDAHCAHARAEKDRNGAHAKLGRERAWLVASAARTAEALVGEPARAHLGEAVEGARGDAGGAVADEHEDEALLGAAADARLQQRDEPSCRGVRVRW